MPIPDQARKKLQKLLRDPNQFFFDYFKKRIGPVAVASPSEIHAPRVETPVKPPKKHPLPTVNHSTEFAMSGPEFEIWLRDPSYFRFRVSATTEQRIVARMSDQVAAFMTNHGSLTKDFESVIRRFLICYEANPARKRSHTTSLNGLLWLYVMAADFRPEVIVESGVFRGSSLFTLRSARPDAEMHAYDIDLSNVSFSDPSIHFHEGDWSESFPVARGTDDLCYFDDHVDNCLRLRQAYELGFRHVIIDDSAEIGELCRWRNPGVPTIQMVLNETLAPGEYVEWVFGQQTQRYVFRESDAQAVADIVEAAAELPQLGPLTGRNGGVQTYVRLKRRQSSEGARERAIELVGHSAAEGDHQEPRELTDAEAWKTQFLSYRASSAAVARVTERVAGKVGAFFEDLGFEPRDYVAEIRDFIDAYPEHPAAGMPRTTAVGGLLWLHLMMRTFEPDVVVESGVFRGASLHTMRRARPEAEFYAFDIDLSNLVRREEGVHYHEGDWSEARPSAKGLNDFCYFDDHINNCLRVRQAYEQGFRHVLFDDSPDIGQLHKWRFPGVPTAQLLANGTLAPGEYVEWVWADKRMRHHYTYDPAHAHGAAEVMERVVELPRLDALTGRSGGVQTYVRLKGPTS